MNIKVKYYGFDFENNIIFVNQKNEQRTKQELKNNDKEAVYYYNEEKKNYQYFIKKI